MLHRATRAIPIEGDCPDDGALLALHQGTLSEAQATQINAHLSRCAACRALTAELATPISEALYARLERNVLPGRRRWQWPAMLAAAVVLVAVIRMAIVHDGRLESTGTQTIEAPAWVPPYVVEGPFGGVALERAAEPATPAPKGPATFTASSRVSFRMAPVEELAGTAPALRIYTRLPNAEWRAIPAVCATAGEGGGFWIDAPALELFGETPGMWEVHLVLLPPNVEPPKSEPSSLAKAREQMPGARWHVTRVDYRGHLGNRVPPSPE